MMLVVVVWSACSFVAVCSEIILVGCWDGNVSDRDVLGGVLSSSVMRCDVCAVLYN